MSHQRTLLEGISRRRETAHSLVRRARIVLRAADGEHNSAIAQALDLGGGVSPNPRKFRQPRLSPATIASRSMSDPVPRNV